METPVASVTLALMALSAQAKDVIIDVRTSQEFAADRISDARTIEYNNIALNTLKSMGISKAENLGGIEQARKTLANK
jgi:rhodanese-related sulfurtransferase